MRVCLNGLLLKDEDVSLDEGWLYGAGLFETMRAYSGQLPFLDRHLDRLQASARTLGLTITRSREELSADCRAVLISNQLDEARLRLSVLRGGTVLVAASAVKPLPRLYRALVYPDHRVEPRSKLSGHKTLCYWPYLMAYEWAIAKGADEALILNTEDRIAEGSRTNLFVVHGRTLRTPALSEGALPGVTRAIVLELADQAGIPKEEGPIQRSALDEADEAFLTSSGIGVMPLAEPGPITRRLQDAYRSLISDRTTRPH